MDKKINDTQPVIFQESKIRRHWDEKNELCAYPLARHVLFPNEPYTSFDIITSKIYRDDKGNTDGYGLKVFP